MEKKILCRDDYIGVIYIYTTKATPPMDLPFWDVMFFVVGDR